MSRQAKVLTSTPEQPSLIAEVYESVGDKERREWHFNSGDWAFAVLQILQGSRRQEVSLSELYETQIYKRSIQREKDALRFVANQSVQLRPVTEDEKIALATTDNFLISVADGTALGHHDIVAAIRAIPERVRRAQAVDHALFHREQFASRELFRWLWTAKVCHG